MCMHLFNNYHGWLIFFKLNIDFFHIIYSDYGSPPPSSQRNFLLSILFKSIPFPFLLRNIK